MWWQTDGKYIKFKLNKYYSNFKFCWQPVWLVGGFGGSPWLLKQLQEGLRSTGSTVNRPDTNLSVYMLYLTLKYCVPYSLQHLLVRRLLQMEMSFLPYNIPSMLVIQERPLEWNVPPSIYRLIQSIRVERTLCINFLMEVCVFLGGMTSSWGRYIRDHSIGDRDTLTLFLREPRSK